MCMCMQERQSLCVCVRAPGYVSQSFCRLCVSLRAFGNSMMAKHLLRPDLHVPVTAKQAVLSLSYILHSSYLLAHSLSFSYSSAQSLLSLLP